MISGRYMRMMARYGRWQNTSLYNAADTLDDAARRAPHGAFWGSIHGTLSHLVWADLIWLSRFDQAEKPPAGLADSAAMIADWQELRERRRAIDATILGWADAFDPGPVTGDLNWYSGAAGRDVSAPLGVVLTHFFNHATHHRGQVHAMLTAAGAAPEDTDLFLMPAAEWAGVGA